MANIPKEVLDLMASEGSTKILVTSDKSGRPHAIVAGTIMSPSPDKMVIGEVLMKKSAKNMQENNKVAFLISAGLKAYEIEARVKVRLDSGPELDGMNEVLANMHLHANAMWVFDVCGVYDQGASPAAGTKLA